MANEYTGLPAGELALRSVLADGFKAIQSDAVELAKLWKATAQPVSDEMLNYLLKNEVTVRLGFAQESFEVPQVSIVVANDTDERYLGDEFMIRDKTLAVSATLGTALLFERPPFDLAYANLSGTMPAFGVITIGDEKFLYDLVTPDEDDATIGTLRIKARGVRKTPKQEHLEDDPIIWTIIEKETGYHTLTAFRIDALAMNGDLAKWIDLMIKAVLLQQSDALIEAGFSGWSVSASDFAPRPQYYPELLYMRSTMFTARFELTVAKDVDPVVSVETFPTVTGTDPPTDIISNLE